MKLRIFTTAWGDKYLQMHKDYAIKSISKSVDKLRKEGFEIEFITYGEKDLEASLRKEIQDSIKQNAYSIMLPPDTIWSEDGLYNLVKIGVNKKYCIAVPHNRIADFDAPTKIPIKATELVKHVFSLPEHAITTLYDDLPKNQTHFGVSVRKISNTMSVMTHNLPTVYFCKFTEYDYRFFNLYKYSNWDRDWLEALISQDRLRVVSSSDICYLVELTVPSQCHGEMRSNLYNDKHYDQKAYNDICAMTTYLLRGE